MFIILSWTFIIQCCTLIHLGHKFEYHAVYVIRLSFRMKLPLSLKLVFLVSKNPVTITIIICIRTQLS